MVRPIFGLGPWFSDRNDLEQNELFISGEKIMVAITKFKKKNVYCACAY